MRYSVESYRGKRLDSLTWVLMMLSEAIGVKYLPHRECLTLRPFAHTCSLNNPRMCIVPYISPTDGLKEAIEIIGVQGQCRILETDADGNMEAFLDFIDSCDRPVVVGPVNKKCIWDRIESSYFDGASHFIFVLARDGENYMVHEPEGCPFFLIGKNKLLDALKGYQFKKIAVRINSSGGYKSQDEIMKETLYKGSILRCKASGGEEPGITRFDSLARNVCSQKLKSSEEAAFYYGILELSMSNRMLFEFLCEACGMPDYGSGEVGNLIGGAAAILEIYNEDCAYALQYLNSRDFKGLSNALIEMSKREADLDGFFRKLKELFEGGIFHG